MKIALLYLVLVIMSSVDTSLSDVSSEPMEPLTYKDLSFLIDQLDALESRVSYLELTLRSAAGPVNKHPLIARKKMTMMNMANSPRTTRPTSTSKSYTPGATPSSKRKGVPPRPRKSQGSTQLPTCDTHASASSSSAGPRSLA